jgi:hypothetical protein
MTLRERVFEDLAADLEYHPRRAAVYLGLAVAALSFWVSLPSEKKSEVVPLVCALGGVALLLKGVFLLRRSSEGLGLTQQELDQLSAPSNPKEFPPMPILLAQLIQDFGTGALLLGPVLHTFKNVNDSWEPPSLYVFLSGAVLVTIGWLIRHFASSPTAPGD